MFGVQSKSKLRNGVYESLNKEPPLQQMKMMMKDSSRRHR